MLSINKNIPDNHVCIIGLGYVGLTLATVMAGLGFAVTGIEKQADVLNKLKKNEPHFFEPSLKGRLKKEIENKRIHFFQEIPKNLTATVFIITVGTPLGDDGLATMEHIKNVSTQVSKVIKDGDIVILRSTVKVGTTRKIVVPILKKSGMSFDVAFCPERTLEGRALIELRQLPQIVGGITIASTVRASHLFQFITPTVVRVSDLETAEMVKLIDNTNRDIMFGYANEVARGCDAIGISALEVIQAGKLGYARTNLPLPGPVGGPCLEKDPYIFSQGLEELGITPEITIAARKVNERQPSEISAYLKKLTEKKQKFSKNPKILLLGLAFKGQPVTDDLRGTMARPILTALKSNFRQGYFCGYDPVVNKKNILNLGLEPFSTIELAMTGANLVLILNNHPDFMSMPIEALSEVLDKPAMIYDLWNQFSSDGISLASGVSYISLGNHGKGQKDWENNYG